jgi:hypothetical protein
MTPAAARLGFYNEALRLLGERPLASLAENREPRRILDSVWDAGAIDYCLEQGQWQFAMRTINITYSPSVEPPFGYRYAFNKPDDLVRVTSVCTDEFFTTPNLRYTDEAGFWFADDEALYVKYVSNHVNYGYDLSLWPQTFLKYVAAYFASEACVALNKSESTEQRIRSILKERHKDAMAKDAMAEPTKMLPTGSWVRARQGGITRRDRGL